MKTILTLFFLLATAVSPLYAAEPLETAIAAYDGFTLGAPARVANVTLPSGHMTFTLSHGTATPILAGSETIGLFFTGSGTYQYVSADPAESAVVKTNAKRATRLTPTEKGGALTLSDTFEQLLYIAPGRAVPAGTAETTTVDASFNAFRQFFDRDTGMPFAHLWAIQHLDAPSAPLVMAQVRGGQEPVVYVYDDALRHMESLEKLEEPQSSIVKKNLYRTTLSEQVINRDRKKYSVQNFLLTAVDLDLTASDKKEASYTITETVTPVGTPRRVFRFDLFDDVIVGGGDVRNFHVRKVVGSDGKPLAFDHRKDEIVVGLPTSLPVGSSATIRFEVDGDFLIRPSGDNYWELGVMPWFPQPELGEQFYTFHAVVRVKKPYIALSPGVTLRRGEEDGYNVVETRIDQPVQFASILAGKYYFKEETRDGLTVRVASYGLKNEMAFKKLANLTHQIVDFYEVFLGPFPFTEFNIIEKNEYGYGQAPPATMFITQEAFNPYDEETSQAYSKGINHRFAHEIAHQYWGHVVKMPSGQEQWLTESFAEYSSALLMKKMKGKRYYDGMVGEWKRNASEANAASSIPMANRLAGDPMIAFQQRTYLVYDKGAYLLAALHKELGDDAFLTFMKSYQKSVHFKFATTDLTASLLQFVTRKDYAPFFDTYFWGTEMPK